MLTFGRISMVAGAISVSSMSCFSMALFLVGVELFLFFRDGDGVPSSVQNQKKKNPRKLHIKFLREIHQERIFFSDFFSVFNSTIPNIKAKTHKHLFYLRNCVERTKGKPTNRIKVNEVIRLKQSTKMNTNRIQNNGKEQLSMHI